MLDALPYIGIFIGFVVIFYFVNKMNKQKIEQLVASAEAVNPMPQLAKRLGLEYESLKEEGVDKRTIVNTGDRISGNYKGIPIEILFKMNTSHSNKFTGAHAYSYTYTSQRAITFKVENPKGNKFQISPVNSSTVGNPIGVAAFDEKLLFAGDIKLPQAFIDYCSEMGWMNLRLKDGNLVFVDDFNDTAMTKTIATAKIRSQVHPIWKTSIQNTVMADEHMIRLLDKMVDLAKIL
ncbi:MAG: hypothetical protein ACI837_000428 [Crocinitomicaceae bacterium]|jgi:hypothetical protein